MDHFDRHMLIWRESPIILVLLGIIHILIETVIFNVVADNIHDFYIRMVIYIAIHFYPCFIFKLKYWNNYHCMINYPFITSIVFRLNGISEVSRDAQA